MLLKKRKENKIRFCLKRSFLWSAISIFYLFYNISFSQCWPMLAMFQALLKLLRTLLLWDSFPVWEIAGLCIIWLITTYTFSLISTEVSMETSRETSVDTHMHRLSGPCGSTAIFQPNSGNLLLAYCSGKEKINLHVGTSDKKRWDWQA